MNRRAGLIDLLYHAERPTMEAYIALAEGLPARLVTCDGKLSRAHGHRAQIKLLV